MESSTIFRINCSEVKLRSERSQRFHFNRIEVKQRSERSERFQFKVAYVVKIELFFFYGLILL